jgi:hypothetical protein
MSHGTDWSFVAYRIASVGTDSRTKSLQTLQAKRGAVCFPGFAFCFLQCHLLSGTLLLSLVAVHYINWQPVDELKRTTFFFACITITNKS